MKKKFPGTLAFVSTTFGMGMAVATDAPATTLQFKDIGSIKEWRARGAMTVFDKTKLDNGTRPASH